MGDRLVYVPIPRRRLIVVGLLYNMERGKASKGNEVEKHCGFGKRFCLEIVRYGGCYDFVVHRTCSCGSHDLTLYALTSREFFEWFKREHDECIGKNEEVPGDDKRNSILSRVYLPR